MNALLLQSMASMVLGIRVVESADAVQVQHRVERVSTRRRRRKNYRVARRLVPCALLHGGNTLLVHPSLMPALKRAMGRLL